MVKSFSEKVRDDSVSRTTAQKAAQRWFVEPALTPVSTAFDEVESAASRRITFGVLVSHYRATRGRNPQNLLDVSCGNGELLALAAELLPESGLFGTDISNEAVNCARMKVPTGSFRVAAAEDGQGYLGWPKFDVAVVHLSLGLWENPAKGLTNIVRSLASDGLLYVVDLLPSAESARRYASASDSKSPDVSSYLHDQLAAALTPHELREVLTESAADLPVAKVVVGEGGLGGFRAGSPEQIRIAEDAVFRETITAGPLPEESQYSHLRLLHGWVDLPPPGESLPDRMHHMPPSGGIDFSRFG